MNNELEPGKFRFVVNDIIELRFKKENIFLIGLWFDSEKPKMTTFLTPLTQMFIDSYHSGIFILLHTNIVGIDVITADGDDIHTTALLLAGILI